MGFQDFQITRPTLLHILYPNLTLMLYFHSSIVFCILCDLSGLVSSFAFQSLNPNIFTSWNVPLHTKICPTRPLKLEPTLDICPRVCLRKKRTRPSYCERLETSPSRSVPFLNSRLHMTSRCMSKQQGTPWLQVKLISGFVVQMYITTLTGRLETLSWRSLWFLDMKVPE